MDIILIKEFMEKEAGAAPARSLAMRESRRNRQGYYRERTTAKASMQADRQKGDSAMGQLSKGIRQAGSAKYSWNPMPVKKVII
jgi:hypothetical protein